ncbi:MAG: DUF4276 family protein [Isosphaeraceae bacterium]
MPRVGILVECGPEGLEVHVCGKICALLQHATGIAIGAEIVPMGNKLQLIEDCGPVARRLFETGCERVVILWDERPPWPDRNEPLCWHHERLKILESLQRERVADRPVSLVCIEREFESWLLHDHRLLSALLSRPTRPVRVPRQNNPDRIDNPKGRMMSLFRQHGATYVDAQYARRIAAALENLDHLRRCPTFRRFAERIVGRTF